MLKVEKKKISNKIDNAINQSLHIYPHFVIELGPAYMSRKEDVMRTQENVKKNYAIWNISISAPPSSSSIVSNLFVRSRD